ncbi:helix-turn-helix transcriptional regulator [Nonomuraea sp. NPDC046802]|uniref:helix-turn-helix domain-containing protein n=1 Tax=Nonomuraea sp. NPDC046802 TaxID=3154919 RepID=UPI003403D095
MARNVDLSEFLGRCRARISPESVGLPERGAYRRVPGLRREEVAQLARVSTDYYTRLKQGRQISPSDSVLQAIAAALRLNDAERAHLSAAFGAAGPAAIEGWRQIMRGLAHDTIAQASPATSHLLDEGRPDGA